MDKQKIKIIRKNDEYSAEYQIGDIFQVDSTWYGGANVTSVSGIPLSLDKDEYVLLEEAEKEVPIDHYSYECGVMDCFCEMVASGLKKLAMSHPCDTKAERDSYLPQVKRLCEKYGILYHPQDEALITDLFLAEANQDKYTYLLAKVEHTDFVDDSDFSFKSGFSKDMKKLWKSCIFEIDDLNASIFQAKVYSNNVAKYWYDNFLELDQRVSDEVNTDKAFRAIDSALNRNIKNVAPRDHTLLRNAVIAYFKSNDYIDYDTMVQSTLENYHPVELEQEKMDKVIEKIRELPDKHHFDKQFNTVSSAINARIRKVYDVCQGVQLKITDAIDDFDNTITAYRDIDGNQYIKIKTDNDLTFRRFSNQE